MKCEDFLPNLETGRWWQRLAARRHADHCPKCAAVRRRFEAAIRGFAEPAELSPDLRAKWRHAAERDAGAAPSLDAPRPAATKPSKRWTFAVACAASIAAAVTAALLLRPEAAREGTEQDSDSHTVDTSQEFTRLESSLAMLDMELMQVEQEIEQMQARQLAADLLRRHGRP